MDPRFQRVCDLFEEARKLPAGADRARFLATSCADDLRAEVESMLAHHEASADADSITSLGPELGRLWEEAAQPAPERIGPYRVLREIGAGGSGTVYEAEQLTPRRRVAVKVLHAGLSARARARFEREGEILAQLDHAGIARILAMEGNAIVMELVDGVPVTRFARGLSIEKRLELLIKVCDVVAHAHQRGVIHRDLKPSNILVDAEGNPKVLDFGLARRLESDGRTLTGLVMGTLGYMSPEQAKGQPTAVDTRTDVYALGVLGYELLSGRLPHQTEGRPITDVLLAIGAEDAPPLGAHDRRLRGDLSVIFAKALARDRERRYQSASAFAEDLGRYLRDEPILARGPAATYQLRKLLKRNKVLVTGVLATVLALAIGLGVALRFADEADRNATALERALARARVETAASDMRLHRPASAQRSLELVPEPLRGWEWRHLARRLKGADELVPWDLQRDPSSRTAELAPAWSDPAWRAWMEEFQPSGLRTAKTHLLDGRSGGTFALADSPLRALYFSGLAETPDGRVVAVSGRGIVWKEGAEPLTGTVAIDVPGRRVIGSLPGLPENLGISSDGRFVATRLGDYELGIWEPATGALRRFRHGHYYPPYAMAFSPDDRYVATGTIDTSVRVHDWRAGKTVRVSRVHTGSVYALAYSPDGRYLASGSSDRTISLWELATGEKGVLLGHAEAVRALHFSADGRRLWSLTSEGRRGWPVPDGSRDVLRHHRSEEAGNRFPYVYGVSFRPDGARLASGGWDQTVRIVDPRDGRLLKTWTFGGVVGAVRYVGPQLVAADKRAVFAWGENDPAPVQILEGRHQAIAATRDGTSFAVARGQYGRGATVFDAATRTATAWTNAEAAEWRWYALAFGPRGTRLALAGVRGACLVTDAKTGRALRRFALGPDICRAVAFDAAGRYLAIACGFDVHLRDARTGAAVHELEEHSGQVYALAFSPDGSRLAAGCYDGTIWIWDPEAGAKLVELTGHTSYVYDLAWSPDGTILASASGDNTVRLWRSE